MKLRTVTHLRSYLKKQKLSPEMFAGKVKISNMTIRRLLKKLPSSAIPSKYHSSFDAYTNEENLEEWKKVAEDFSPLFQQLEQQGAAITDREQLKKDVSEKVREKEIGSSLKDKAKFLLDTAFGKGIDLRQRALAQGALLYFINPVDMIPDATPIFGYVDDFAIMSLVVTGLIALKKSDGIRKAVEE